MAVEDDAAGLAYTDGLWMHSGAGDALIHSPKVNRADDWSIEKFGSKSDDIHADSFDAFNLSADSTIWHEQFQLTPLATQGKSQFETPIALVLTEPTPVREEFDLLEINEPPKQQANSTLAVDTTLIDTTVDCNNLRDIDSELWIPESSGLRRSLRAPPGLSHPSATPLQGSSNNTLSPPGPSTVTRPPPGLTKSRSFGSPLSPQGYPGNLSTLSGSNFPHTDNSNVKKEDDLIMAEEYVGLPASFGIARTTSTPTHGVNSASFQMQQRSLKNSLLTELKESLVSAGSSQSSLAPVENTDISLSPAQNPPRWLFTRNGYKSRWAENVVDRPRNEYLSQEDLDNRRKRYKRLLQRLPALYVYGNEKPPIIEFVGAGW
ncbi:hypothetical protein BZA77DRAFT_326416 [Pyronema omphalodes]|nr:hypothetical protein BZA77DRAFT_326416 [Pyronema omphalodes]